MGNIVDGIQRPLRVCFLLIFQNIRDRNPTVDSRTFKVYLHSQRYQHRSFRPHHQMGLHTNKCQGAFANLFLPLILLSTQRPLPQIGDHVSGGDIFGRVYENSLVDAHKIMLNPRAMGTITHIAEKGSYAVDVRSISVSGRVLIEGDSFRMSFSRLNSTERPQSILLCNCGLFVLPVR